MFWKEREGEGKRQHHEADHLKHRGVWTGELAENVQRQDVQPPAWEAHRVFSGKLLPLCGHYHTGL